MKQKVNFFDKTLIKDYLATLGIISLFCSFAMIALPIPDEAQPRIIIGLIITMALLSIYIAMWLSANRLKLSRLKINNSDLEVRVGDIFSEPEIKVIAFNEYFDTIVDDRIIAANTLNGKLLKKLHDKIRELDESINNDPRLQNRISGVFTDRPSGKKTKYKLGSIHLYDDYAISAFSRFDENNRAFLNMQDYVDFLLDFWNEIDIVYAGRSVSIPLFGSGITRFKDYSSISEQELLEIMIWSFKVSRIRFAYPSKASIIIHESITDKINFFKLKEF